MSDATRTAPERIDIRDLVSDLVRAVEDDCASYERGHGRREREVNRAREEIVTEYHALHQRYEEAITALRACEENLRLVHEAAGPLERGAPMPSHCTFDAWRLADEALRRHAERATPKDG